MHCNFTGRPVDLKYGSTHILGVGPKMYGSTRIIAGQPDTGQTYESIRKNTGRLVFLKYGRHV